MNSNVSERGVEITLACHIDALAERTDAHDTTEDPESSGVKAEPTATVPRAHAGP